MQDIFWAVFLRLSLGLFFSKVIFTVVLINLLQCYGVVKNHIICVISECSRFLVNHYYTNDFRRQCQNINRGGHKIQPSYNALILVDTKCKCMYKII